MLISQVVENGTVDPTCVFGPKTGSKRVLFKVEKELSCGNSYYANTQLHNVQLD